MDKRKLLLLKYLLNNCDSGYKVLDISNIFDANKKYKDNFKNLQNDITFLSQYKYIDVKYIDESSICLSVLDNTRIFQENLKVEGKTKRSYIISLVINMIFSGVMAFCGAFLAILLFK